MTCLTSGRAAQPLAVAGLVRQVREHGPQVADSETDPPVLAVKAQQRLRDRQADQLGLAQPDRVARMAVLHQPVVEEQSDGSPGLISAKGMLDAQRCPATGESAREEAAQAARASPA
jgi:hypothetical protein